MTMEAIKPEEHKTPSELISEIDYQIARLSIENHEMKLKTNRNNEKIRNLVDRKQSILNYVNTK